MKKKIKITIKPYGPHSLGDAVRGRQHPLGADQRAAAQVLVQRVDERHLPAPFGRVRVFAADHSGRPRPGRSLYAAHVFAVRGRLGRHRGIGRGQR